MANLKQISDQELLGKVRELVMQEREVGIHILHHLSELKRRKLHVELGFSSFFLYLVEDLKYSNGDAYRKIEALNLLEELPELEEKLQSGALTLTHMTAVQSHCKNQERVQAVKLEPQDKRALLLQIEGKSTRAAENILATIALGSENPSPPPEFARAVAGGRWVELKISIPQELHEELKRIQALWSHALPDSSYVALLQKMADHILHGIDPEKKEERRQRRQEKQQEKKIKCVAPLETPSTTEQLPALEVAPRSRTISPQVRRQVWLRDHGVCGFIAKETGRKCGETRFLELDHIVPWARGGSNDPSNLQNRCRRHNFYAATLVFGKEHMASFEKK